MPKLKTHSSAKKRFSLTGSGKVKRRHAGMRHNLGKKSGDRKLRLGNSAVIECKGDERRVQKMLCVH